MRNKITYLLTCLIVSGSSLAQSVYKDNSYSPEERAEDLVKQLTLEEKVSLMMDNSKPVERLGIKPYNWWNEALHGVARSGLATVFPQPIGMAASFSPEALHTAFVAVSDEARAKNAVYSKEGSYKRYQGLTIFSTGIHDQKISSLFIISFLISDFFKNTKQFFRIFRIHLAAKGSNMNC